MNTATEGEVLERELPSLDIEHNTANLISTAEINQQIATAKRFPRSLKSFRDEALQMVTLTQEIAQECIYALPRDGKVIEGPSARMAEVLASAWGNCRAGARVVDEAGEFVTAQGGFYDLQKNVAITYEVKRRITDRKGRRYTADMIGVTANAACSIALRNAVLKGIPKAFWNDIYKAARKVIMGDFSTLSNRRAEALKAFQAFGVTDEMIYDMLGVKGKEDVTIEHLVVLSGLLTAIREGDTTVEQAFPPKQQPGETPRSGASALKQAVTGNGHKEEISEPSTSAAEKQAAGQANAAPPSDITVIDVIAKFANFDDLDKLAEYADVQPDKFKNDARFSNAYRKRAEEIKKVKSQPIATGTRK